MTTIEVFADVRCPFTHVGLRRLAARRAERGRTDVLLWVRAWPLELVNGEPLDPVLIGDEIDALRAQVAPDLFEGFAGGRFAATSLPALALASAAYATSPRAGEHVSLALRDAQFEHGRDIADPEVLAELAAEAGVDPPGPEANAAVLADWEEGRTRGVIGSPHFIVGGQGFFCPALDISHVDGHFRISADGSAFDAFVNACLDA